jgi:hypothetical protein
VPLLRSFLFFLLLGLPFAPAQEEQLNLDPPLREIFPLESTPTGVRVKYPVLLSDHLILRPSALLRFIYLDPNAVGRAHGGGGGGFRRPAGPGDHGVPNGETDGAWGKTGGDEDAGIFDDKSRDDVKQRKTEMQNEIWTRPALFAEALDHASEEGTTIVYSLPPQNRPQTATLDLPEGMLLAEIDGHVRVLGLTGESRAFAGGLRAGDEILSLNGGAPIRTLDDFLREYAATRRQAKLTGNATYAMELRHEGQPASIQIAAPPTLPSFF